MFDLLLHVDDQPDGLYPLFQYNSDLFDEATVVRMAGHYRTLLAALAADPGRLIARSTCEQRRAGRDRGLEPDRQGVRPVAALRHTS